MHTKIKKKLTVSRTVTILRKLDADDASFLSLSFTITRLCVITGKNEKSGDRERDKGKIIGRERERKIT